MIGTAGRSGGSSPAIFGMWPWGTDNQGANHEFRIQRQLFCRTRFDPTTESLFQFDGEQRAHSGIVRKHENAVRRSRTHPLLKLWVKLPQCVAAPLGLSQERVDQVVNWLSTLSALNFLAPDNEVPPLLLIDQQVQNQVLLSPNDCVAMNSQPQRQIANTRQCIAGLDLAAADQRNDLGCQLLVDRNAAVLADANIEAHGSRQNCDSSESGTQVVDDFSNLRSSLEDMKFVDFQ